MKKLSLSTILLFPILIFAQDIIYTVGGKINEEKVTLNAIHFENISNGTSILFDSLPDVDDYQINLTQKSYWGTTNIKAFEKPTKFVVSQNFPGNLIVLYNWDQPTDLRVSIFNINGQKVYSSGKRILQGKNSIRIQLGPSHLFLVLFETGLGAQTFKVIGSENIHDYSVKISDEKNFNVIKSNLVDFSNEFSFSIGDSIRISAYKSGYYAEPVGLKVTGSEAVNFLFEESQYKNFLKINDNEYELSDGLIAYHGNFEGKGVYNHDLYLISPEHNFDFETLQTDGTGAVAIFNIFNTKVEIENGIYLFSLPEDMNTDTICGIYDINDDGIVNDDDCDSTLPDGKFYISSSLSEYDNNANLQEFRGMEFQSGKVIITKDGDFFTIEFDCIGKNGDLIKGFYSGQIHYYDVLAEVKEITIDVIDVDTWSPANPGGDYAENAIVKLLDRNNPDKNSPLYEGMTDSNGRVIFNQVQQDDYFVYIEKGNQSNVIEKEIINGKEVGFLIGGIFQNQAELDQSSVKLPGTSVGDPKLVDVNGDGILNVNDKTVGYSIFVYDNTSFTNYISGFDPFLLKNETEINDTLSWCYSKLHEYVEFTFLFDAIYCNSYPASDNSWNEIYEHSQTINNEKILQLWSDAYNIIYKTNLVIKSAEGVISDPLTRNTIVAQAKAMRAYLFYNLLIWFGEIPLEEGISASMIPRNSEGEVLEQIKHDAAEVALSLPMNWNEPDKFRFPKSFAWGLMARTSLFDKNYTEALPPIQNIINSGIYALDQDTVNFLITSTEIFCGFEKSDDIEFDSFFTKGSFVPLMRYTESILFYAELLLNTGNTESSIDFINQINIRRNKPFADSLTDDDLYQHWKTELGKEGSMFITLKRFGKALSVLQISKNKLVLPLPTPVLNNNPYLIQNSGY